MNYIDNVTMEYPISLIDIQQKHPNVIMPQSMRNYSLVLNSDIPNYDHLRQKVQEGTPVIAPDELQPEGAVVEHVPDVSEDGVEPPTPPAPYFIQVWEVVDLPKEEADANVAAWEKEQAEASVIRITKRQALIALFVIKKIKDSDVLAAIDRIPDEDDRYMAKINWEGAVTIDNNSPFTSQIGDLLGLTEEEMNSMFRYAQTQ